MCGKTDSDTDWCTRIYIHIYIYIYMDIYALPSVAVFKRHCFAGVFPKQW